MTPFEQRLVTPFYLAMMRTNALTEAAGVWPELVEAGRRATAADLRRLFDSGAWRGVVMAAWFAPAVPRDEIEASLARATDRCGGSLTAPPLAVACVLVGGDLAPDALARYGGSAVGSEMSAGLVGAALEHVRRDVPAPVSNADRADFDGLLSIGRSLAHAIVAD